MRSRPRHATRTPSRRDSYPRFQRDRPGHSSATHPVDPARPPHHPRCDPPRHSDAVTHPVIPARFWPESTAAPGEDRESDADVARPENPPRRCEWHGFHHAAVAAGGPERPVLSRGNSAPSTTTARSLSSERAVLSCVTQPFRPSCCMAEPSAPRRGWPGSPVGAITGCWPVFIAAIWAATACCWAATCCWCAAAS